MGLTEATASGVVVVRTTSTAAVVVGATMAVGAAEVGSSPSVT